MALQNTDLLLVERGGTQFHMTANQIAEFFGIVEDHTATDIADRDANYSASPAVKVGDRVFVADASGDPDVASGWAIYRVASLAPAAYNKVQEQESLDIVIPPTNLGYTASPTGGTVTSSSGNDVTLPVVDATNAGLATPDMLAKTHVAATAGLTPTNNPIVIDPATQVATFSIAQLSPLP